MASFGKRDLALFLPDQVGDTISLRHTELEADKFEPLKPKIDQSKKVVRYFPNKAPKWHGDDPSTASNADSSHTIQKPAEIDKRLARLARLNAATSSNENDDESRPRRRIYEAEVIVEMGDEEDASDDDDKSESKLINADFDDGENEDDVVARRERILQRRALQQSENDSHEAEYSTVNSASIKKEETEEYESEYETDSDDYSDDDRQILKPVFIPRNKRDTIKEQQMKEEEELLKEKKRQIQADKRKEQTKEMVADCIRRKEEEKVDITDADSDAGLPDDTDDLDDEMEFENWKLREMARLKRDAEQREAAAMEKSDLERRRQMTDAQRMEEDRKLGRFDAKEKTKWKFMQKYYHKGVFYMDDDSLAKDKQDVRTRDYNAPTLEDRVNKEALPAVLQVKKFGMRGRTKYTHLLDQDTTVAKQNTGVSGSSFFSMTAAPSLSSGVADMGGGAMGTLGVATVKIRPMDNLVDKYMKRRGGVGDDLDNAGRVSKKSKQTF